MKYPHTRFIASLTIGAVAAAGLATAFAQSANHPTVITPPAVPNGSNWSRAPFPAQRQFDDTKPADAQAIDQLPPNTPATNIEQVPATSVAVRNPFSSSTAVATVTSEPMLTPTGRATVMRSTEHPTVITPPAVPNGSNWSRAPFPGQRQFDDTKPADAQAIDQLPPNTQATNIEQAPPARVAVRNPIAPSTTTVATVTTAPALTPTGRTTVVVATPLEVTTFAPTIRAANFGSRDQMIADIEARVKQADHQISAMHSTMSQMGTDARQQFKAAADDVKAKAKVLHATIKEARKATDANWDSVRAQLASDYEAYAAAVARIDAASNATIQ